MIMSGIVRGKQMDDWGNHKPNNGPIMPIGIWFGIGVALLVEIWIAMVVMGVYAALKGP